MSEWKGEIVCKDFRAAIERVKPGIGSNSPIAEFSGLAIMDGVLTSYNDEISVRYPVEELKGLTGFVQPEQLYGLLSKLPTEGKVSLSVREDQLRVRCDRVRAGIPFREEVRLPLDEMGDDPPEFKELPKDFLLGLEFVTPSCAADMSRPVLTCIHARAEGILEASDGFRITRYQCGKLPCPDFLLPCSAARELVKFDVQSVGAVPDSGWVHFQTADGVVFSCRIASGEFPDVEPFFDSSGAVPLPIPVSIAESLDRARVFTKAAAEILTDEWVAVVAAKGKLRIAAETPAGWLREDVPCDYDGEEEVAFNVSPIFLREVAGRSDRCAVNVEGRRLFFFGDHWTHVIALRSGS